MILFCFFVFLASSAVSAEGGEASQSVRHNEGNRRGRKAGKIEGLQDGYIDVLLFIIHGKAVQI